MPLIQVEQLTKRFGDLPAVERLTFSVNDRAFCTLLGPSGCGKSTTLRILAGLEPPEDGVVRFGSRVVSSGSGGVIVPPERRRVGLVFQSYALWPHMTVFDHVAFPLRIRGFDKETVRARVADALELVHLDRLDARYPSEVSGGQQQRVALARAIVGEPEILLLDEPLSNLDAELRREMRVELRRLHERLGVTTVYVTHDQAEALAMSDIIVVMDRGRIVETGTGAAIYERPRTEYCARFVGGANVLTGRLRASDARGADIDLGSGIVVRTTDVVNGISAGGTVAVAIKPEDIRLLGEAAPGTDHMRAIVESATYAGAHTDVVLRLADSLINARAPKQLRVTAGSSLVVEMPAHAVRVVERSAGTN